MLANSIGQCMTHEEFASYREAITVWKNKDQTQTAENIEKALKKISRLEQKVLSCSGETNVSQKERAATYQEKPSQRIKMKGTGKKGKIQSHEHRNYWEESGDDPHF